MRDILSQRVAAFVLVNQLARNRFINIQSVKNKLEGLLFATSKEDSIIGKGKMVDLRTLSLRVEKP